MDIFSFAIVMFILLFSLISGMLIFVLFKINVLASNILKIVSSFSTIETDIKLIDHELDTLKETLTERDNLNKDTILSAINNLIRRLEALQTTIGDRLERIERTLNMRR